MLSTCDRQEILQLFRVSPLRQFDSTRQLGLNFSAAALFVDAPCLNQCLFCGAHLDNQRIFSLPNRIHSILKCFKRKRIVKLLLLGEEVLNHPNILDIVSWARNYGFKEVEIQTSGEPLADRHFVKKLVKIGVTSFSFPLYGPEKIHDYLVGRTGSYQMLIDAIDGLRNISSIKVFLHSILMRPTIQSLGYLVDLCSDHRYSLSIIPLKSKRFLCDTTEWIMPLDEAIEVVPRKRIEWLSFPLCFIRRVQPKLFFKILKSNRNYQKQLFRKIEDKSSDSLFFYTRVFKTRHPHFCQSCVLFEACPGVPLGYQNLYGTQGLEKFTEK